MTRNIATFRGIAIDDLLRAFAVLGFDPRNPDTGETLKHTGFEEPAPIAPEEVGAFLASGGGGIVFWRGPYDCFFLSTSDGGRTSLFFDGFTVEQEARLCAEMREEGLVFTVAHEEDVDDA